MTDFKRRDPRWVCAPWWRKMAHRWFGLGLPRVGMYYDLSRPRDVRDHAWVKQWKRKHL